MSATASARWEGCILVLAVVLAVLGARSEAGGWNDGSRLATVECLVDYRTWAIDRSIFVAVPRPVPGQPTPYPRDDLLLMQRGTLDKLWISGHFYSDKSPVPALLLAGEYWFLQGLTGWTAQDRPAGFCWVLTLGSSGLAYVLAIWCLWRLGLPLGLGLQARLLLTASLALTTVAWTYSQQVNNHILLLTVALAMLVELAWLAHGTAAATNGRLVRLGLLAGLGYSIDLGAGPIFLGLTGLWLLACCRRPGLLVCFLAAALPGLLLHHGLNYAIGGSWKPANALPEHFHWPGCPFTPQSLTGGWQHPSVGKGLVYSLALLFGKKGFLLYNLPLLLALAGSGLLLLRRHRDRPLCLLAAGWGVGIWLIYGICSTNHSGFCCSVRWFVPLLAPGYYLLAVLLRDYPEFAPDFLLLSAGGLVLGVMTAWTGPWHEPSLTVYWCVVGVTLAGWAGLALRRWIATRSGSAEPSLAAASGWVCQTSVLSKQWSMHSMARGK